MDKVDFQQLVEGAGDAIVVADVSGRIVLWNQAAERIFGFTEHEALGQTLDLIIPERLRPRHWAGYHKTMASGQTRYGAELLRVPAAHRDGRPLSIAFTVSLLHGADGRVSGIASIIRDETARWNEERAMKARLRELEGG